MEELNMDKNKKKELVSEWKERHPEIGVMGVKCVETGEEFYDSTKDSNHWFNRHRFELNAGNHRNKRLQELWNLYTESGFEFSMVSELEYEELSDVKVKDLKDLLELCLLENPNA